MTSRTNDAMKAGDGRCREPIRDFLETLHAARTDELEGDLVLAAVTVCFAAQHIDERFDAVGRKLAPAIEVQIVTFAAGAASHLDAICRNRESWVRVESSLSIRPAEHRVAPPPFGGV